MHGSDFFVSVDVMGDEAAGARGREARGGSVPAGTPAASPPSTPGIAFEWDRDLSQVMLDALRFYGACSLKVEECPNLVDLIDIGEADLVYRIARYDGAVAAAAEVV